MKSEAGKTAIRNRKKRFLNFSLCFIVAFKFKTKTLLRLGIIHHGLKKPMLAVGWNANSNLLCKSHNLYNLVMYVALCIKQMVFV